MNVKDEMITFSTVNNVLQAVFFKILSCKPYNISFGENNEIHILVANNCCHKFGIHSHAREVRSSVVPNCIFGDYLHSYCQLHYSFTVAYMHL